MTPEQWEALQAAFEEAMALSEPERNRFVQSQFADDLTLKTELERLLAATDTDDESLLEPVVAAAASVADAGTDPWIGKAFGSYEAIKRIATGGMSAVYLGRRTDDEFEQKVAIKIVAGSILSEDLQRRFKVERQILASLQHRYVAQLYDGGTTSDGLLYFVMEYVEGLPIDEFCDKNTLSIGDRLELFSKLCTAVDYAHRNLVVHRDIKPSNIIVSTDGTPKLLDFGIAKPLDQAQIKQTIAMTRADVRAMTPEYASPEQVRGENITTATDVYSLGVLLYKLLSGHMPYLLNSHSVAAVAKVICETMPSRPSTIVDGDAETAPRIVALRGTTISKLQKTLTGDLDNIVLATLHKDPERRYPSARALSEDIARYRADEPVHARPDSLAYRIGKSLRRNRLAVAVGTLFVLTIIGLISFYTLQLTEERDRARLEANRAEQVAVFLTDLFEEANPARNFGEPMNARELLDAGAARISEQLSQQPELKAALAATIGESYTKMRENKTARDYLEPLVAEMETRLGKEDTTVLRLRRLYASSMMHLGDPVDAKPMFQEDYQTWLRVAGPDDRETGVALQRLAEVESQLGNDAEAEEHFLRALANLRQHGDSATLELSDTLMTYGVLLRNLSRVEEEEALLFEALALQEKRVGKDHADYAGIINNLGTHHFQRGNVDTAAEFFDQHREMQKKLVGEYGVAYANALMNSSSVLKAQARYDESLAMMDEALVIFRRGYGEDSVPYAYLNENRANALMDMQRYDESEAAFQIALAIIGEKFGTDHQEYAFTQGNYGTMLERAGRLEEGVIQLRAAVEINVRTYGEDHRQSIIVKSKLASALNHLEDWDAALLYAAEAVDSARRVWTEPHPKFVDALAILARTHRGSENYSDAESYYKEAIEMASQLEGDSLRRVISIETAYAKGLVAEGRISVAHSLLSQRAEQIASFDETWDRQREGIDEVLESIAAASVE